MDYTRKGTKKYTFKDPDLESLKDLKTLVANPEKFRHKYGGLLSILKTKVEDGILETLVQFYDPLYHCFTFPDYQLAPTLEEYSYIMDVPVRDGILFTSQEDTPKNAVIAAALRLNTPEIRDNLGSKGGFLGLNAKFLISKARTLAEAGNTPAFDAIFALLIYGLVLFPNVDNFVDMNAIKVFLTRNPVPTLLAEAYHSIHHRTQVGRGTILCCAPLLYKWFISHLPDTPTFLDNPDNLLWSQRIMALTPEDVVWYHAAGDSGIIIDSCGEFPNVPLIGIRGGITYNPVLARRQLGYPTKTKPNSLALAAEFYLNGEDTSGMRERFVQAWQSIHRKNKDQLGRRSSFAHQSYIQWVIDRARSFGMPFPMSRTTSTTTPSVSLPVTPDTAEEYQEHIRELTRERDAWRARCQEAERQSESLSWKMAQRDQTILELNQRIVRKNILLQKQDDMLGNRVGKKARMDLFSYSSSDSDEPSGHRA